ncbi:cold-shock protein [Fulvivirga lutea]|uniref:Cold shock domain-containing protein n=1 Tax=Fulvivirga lutea TaxID=2810512 RepID=A0A974WE39_9BACT|nr:cold shock domain-containing protein [Fulvivirga lutea]QSE96316.1 cold shock domain-containing protein [Fulvivirga lutea]
MGRSQNTFLKKEREKKKLQKRKEKQEKKEERKANSTSGDLDEMMAYLDENGNIVDSPPDETKKKKEIKAKDIEIGVPKSAPQDLTSERRGKVAFFNDAKGYGFIDQNETNERFFVHVNSLKSQIREGDKVGFKLEKGPKGLVAIEVKVVR